MNFDRKTTGRILLISATSFLLVLLTGILRTTVSFMASTFLGSIAYFGITLFFLRKYSTSISDKFILVSLLFGISVMQLSVRIGDFSSTLISLPDFLFHLLAIFVGFIYFKANRMIRLSAVIAALGMMVFMCLIGYNLWIHKLNFGTYTGSVSE